MGNETISNPLRPKRKQNVIDKEFGEELFVYSTDNEKGLILNGCALAIWELCDGVRTIEGIAGELSGRFEGCAEEIHNDVTNAVANLQELGYLV